MKKILILTMLVMLLTGCTNQGKVNALTLQEAQEIALKEVTGKEVLEAKEDKDDGIDIYEFTIITETEKYEIDIDANTGDVLKVDKDDDYLVTTTDSKQVVTEIKTTNNDQATTDTTTNQQTMLQAKKAQEIAMNRVGGGTITKCELDKDDGILVYEIEIKNGNKEYDLDINAYTGAIVDYDEDIDDDDITATTSLSQEEAKNIALKRVGAGQVTKCELDDDDGITIYEIEIKNGNYEYDFEINADNGAIISYDEDYDD